MVAQILMDDGLVRINPYMPWRSEDVGLCDPRVGPLVEDDRLRISAIGYPGGRPDALGQNLVKPPRPRSHRAPLELRGPLPPRATAILNDAPEHPFRLGLLFRQSHALFA
jgi:hypothetical protein